MEDPFNTFEAKYDFYQLVEQECCKDFEHVVFPEYSPAKVNLVSSENIDILAYNPPLLEFWLAMILALICRLKT